MVTVKLKTGEAKRIRSGHLWIFSNEIAEIDGSVSPGDAVYVTDSRGRLLGTGYINPHSLISVRLVSRSRVELTRSFFARRIAGARAFRQKAWRGERTYRAIYGEADLLPGLVVDRYEDCLVVQSLTAGMEKHLEMVVEALVEVFNPSTIVLRNDSPMRTREQLPLEKSVVKGTVGGPVEIEQDGHRFLVDVLDGQKTGFFLDQRENRRVTSHLAKGWDVLDCCCYTGAWSIYAAGAGAGSVAGIDSSASALELAARNAELNGVGARVALTRGNVFKELASLRSAGRRFDMVILDPPAFARSRKHIREALKAYRSLNRLALSVARPGGFLVTCSCSHLVERQAFMNALVDASREAGRRAIVVEVRGQSRDHPVLLGIPETEYLKCVILEVL